MPKKGKRRPFKRRPQDRSEDVANQQRRTEAAARSLLGSRTPDQLRSELADRQLLLDEADRAAQLDPNPANLTRYRAARSEMEAARRAVQLANDDPGAPAGDGR